MSEPPRQRPRTAEPEAPPALFTFARSAPHPVNQRAKAEEVQGPALIASAAARKKQVRTQKLPRGGAARMGPAMAGVTDPNVAVQMQMIQLMDAMQQQLGSAKQSFSAKSL